MLRCYPGGHCKQHGGFCRHSYRVEISERVVALYTYSSESVDARQLESDADETRGLIFHFKLK